jgi:Fe-S-cluster containining protein
VSAVEGFPEPVDENGHCVHLTADNGCAIYDKRPLICRVLDAWDTGVTGMDIEVWLDANAQACNDLQAREGLDTKYRLPVLGVWRPHAKNKP